MLSVERSSASAIAHAIAAAEFDIAGPDLIVEGLRVRDLAQAHGTPLYIYSVASMRRAYRNLMSALAGFAEVYFSIKANPNPAIAAIFVREGAGIEVASGAEYLQARKAGAAPERIIFAGPGKTVDELALVLRAGIGEIHLETAEEIEAVGRIARELQIGVPVAIRVNPVAAAQGGAMRMGGKPSAFGFDEESIDSVITAITARPELDLRGLHMFAGTQILDADVLGAQWSHGLTVAEQVGKFLRRPLSSIDLGGGLGIPYYAGDRALDLNALASHAVALKARLNTHPFLQNARVIVEPGRFLAGPAGIYVARVIATKISRGEKFLVTDGGMHHHLAASGNLGQIIKRDFPIVAATRMADPARHRCIVTGPLCTPLDTLARQAELPDLKPGDLVAILQSGAYGLTASPIAFLSHRLPGELLVEDGVAREIRPRGSFEAPLGV
jgi:diaminopimelate decarboxylase